MSDVLALMSRDDADELLVAQLGVFLLAAKHSETKADEYILQAAIDRREVRLFLLERLGFGSPHLAFAVEAAGEPLPLFENVATAMELFAFLKKYGPQIKEIVALIAEIVQLFKGIKPSVPSGPVEPPNMGDILKGETGLPPLPKI